MKRLFLSCLVVVSTLLFVGCAATHMNGVPENMQEPERFYKQQFTIVNALANKQAEAYEACVILFKHNKISEKQMAKAYKIKSKLDKKAVPAAFSALKQFRLQLDKGINPPRSQLRFAIALAEEFIDDLSKIKGGK